MMLDASTFGMKSPGAFTAKLKTPMCAAAYIGMWMMASLRYSSFSSAMHIMRWYTCIRYWVVWAASAPSHHLPLSQSKTAA